ncbi:MAG: hypothetical protein ACI9CQ_004670 [Saprospiraceae bacterium]
MMRTGLAKVQISGYRGSTRAATLCNNNGGTAKGQHKKDSMYKFGYH